MDPEILQGARGERIVVQAGDQTTCLLLVSGKPIEASPAIAKACHEHGVPGLVDGARVWGACPLNVACDAGALLADAWPRRSPRRARWSVRW